MNEQTKKYLIIGGVLVGATVLGIIVYKKVQVSSEASAAASDQASQDELAYIESMALQNPYEGVSGAGTAGITLPSAPAGPSLIDELTQLEQAFGLAPAPTSSSGSTAPSSPAPSGGTPPPAGGSTSGAPAPKQPPTQVPPKLVERTILEGEPPIFQDEGVLVA
jgi:hypothetical protein